MVSPASTLRSQRRFDLDKNPRQPVGPRFLAGLIRNQILTDFDSRYSSVRALRREREWRSRSCPNRIGLVVADDQTWLLAQRASSSSGSTLSRWYSVPICQGRAMPA